MSGAVRYFEIPAGAKGQACRADGCNHLLYMVPTGKMKPDGKTPSRAPVTVLGDDQCRAPTATRAGVGISHFSNCPGAQQFRRNTSPTRRK